MGFHDGKIILDSKSGAYYAGQTIYGRMVFSLDKVTPIRGIYVETRGYCSLYWATKRSRKVNNRTNYYTVHHVSDEEYLRTNHCIFGNGNDEQLLKSGQHVFNFECPIPADSPSSFEGSHGNIRYRIKVVLVHFQAYSIPQEKSVPFKVHAPLDLNQNPYCREPIEFDISSTYYYWCMNAGSSKITVKMPVAGYCPGQIIPIKVRCRNNSSVKIDEIKFAITKIVTYTADHNPDQRKDQYTVAEIKKGPVPTYTTRSWNVEMEVPAMVVHNAKSCCYIDIDYHFKVSSEVSGSHKGTEETRPLIIGTIPMVGFQEQNTLHNQAPRSTDIRNVQRANCYPPPLIPHPNGNV